MQVNTACNTPAGTLEEKGRGEERKRRQDKFTELPELLVQNKDLESLTSSEGIARFWSRRADIFLSA